ncbi:MAG: hypothetical protein ACREDA_04225, partial [Methylocella sp.]
MMPLRIGVCFAGGEQAGLGSIAYWMASLVHEFGFQRVESAFLGGVVPAISAPAYGASGGR